MARKRKGASSLAKLTRRVASRKRAKRNNPAPKSNPGLLEDTWNLVLPGLVAYGGTRLAGRIAYKVARKKSPMLAKHVGALAPVGVAALTWFAVHKVDRLNKYHNGAVIGTFIAAAQAIMQTYMPQYSWILNDYHLDDVLPLAAQTQTAQGPGQQVAAAASTPASVADFAASDPELAELLGPEVIDGDLETDGLSGGIFSGGLAN